MLSVACNEPGTSVCDPCVTQIGRAVHENVQAVSQEARNPLHDGLEKYMMEHSQAVGRSSRHQGKVCQVQ